MYEWLPSAHFLSAIVSMDDANPLPAWLRDATITHLPWTAVAYRLAGAVLLGPIVAGIYAATQRRPTRHVLPLITTLILLTILVTMSTVVIGDSVARAFSLLGALSIVRFRTIVDDTRDTSFVIFAVVIGMATGAGNLLVCLIGIPAVAFIAFALFFFGKSFSPSTQRLLEVRLNAGLDPESLLTPYFRTHLHTWHLANVVSARQGTLLEVAYRVRLNNAAAILPLVKILQNVEGIFEVNVKEERT